MFTNLKGPFTCPYGAMVQGTSVYGPIQISIMSDSSVATTIFFGLPTWVESALTAGPHCPRNIVSCEDFILCT